MTGEHEDEHRALELELLLEGVFRRYHYDFRGYARSSLMRRVEQARTAMQYRTITGLLDGVLHDPLVFAALLEHLTIQVSNLFRDPGFWRALRERVLPHLATYPQLRVWIAGCGAGEEAYSMAILLHEEGLLERTRIYATDIDAASLHRAEAGVYDLSRMRGFSDSYFQAGGRASLSDYYRTSAARAVFEPAFRQRILFSDHSLATDTAFAEVQLVTCRNVLIYFDEPLQARALGVFARALCPRGFLGLGSHESLHGLSAGAAFEAVDATHKIYRMKVAS